MTAAARALRRRQKVRTLPTREQPSQGVYDELVRTSRASHEERTARRGRSQGPAGPGDGRLSRPELRIGPRTSCTISRWRGPTAAPGARRRPVGPGSGVGRGSHARADGRRACRWLPAAASPRPTRPCRRAARPLDDGSPTLAAPAAGRQRRPGHRASPGRRGRGTGTRFRSRRPAGGPGARQPRRAAHSPRPRPSTPAATTPAAREVAGQAKATRLGVDAQADELIAQIGLAEQGGALALYEEALKAVRKGNTQRARDLLTEVAAAGDSLDEGLRAKVQGLLEKLSKSNGSKPGTASTVDAVQDAETIAAQKLNAEVGTQIAEARRYHDIDPDKALAIYEKEIQAVQASGLPPELTRPMVRRLEVAIELAKKDKAVYLIKMTDKKQREEIELKRLRILEADGAKKAKVKDLMDKAMAYYAEGKYVECEAYCKRAMEIDPNELAASMLAFKAKMERRFKADNEISDAKEEGVVTALQGVDRAADLAGRRPGHELAGVRPGSSRTSPASGGT